jgi:hypothetical protein
MRTRDEKSRCSHWNNGLLPDILFGSYLLPRIDWFFSQTTVVSTRLADVAFATPFLMLGAIETNTARTRKINLR